MLQVTKSMQSTITRIVKLQISDDHSEEFMRIFDAHAIRMQSVEGCLDLKLLRDTLQRNTFFTISQWQTEFDLQTYRSSELFNMVWSKVKPLFCARPEAWTTQELKSVR
jgi:quinol monooxygenase YgiN